MRTTDDTPIDPLIAAQLDAIDATLAGEPVDPRYAEIAELALLLAADRPEPRREFLDELDSRVERRFAPAPSGAGGGASTGGIWERFFSLGSMPVFGTAAAGLVAAVVAVVVLTSGGGSGPANRADSEALTPATNHGVILSPQSGAYGTATSASSATTGASAPKAAAPAPTRAAAPGVASGSAASTAAGAPNAAAFQGAAPAAAPAPQANGRKIVQSAQLALTARPRHIDDVSQEVFNVVGKENGIVQRSSVTASGTPGSYAQFQLSIPSANLATTMAQLSRLPYAHVASRTDSTQDVNNQFASARRALADQQALRTSLLKQLAAAFTTQAIDAIQARLHGVNAKINGLQLQLKRLNHRVAYSDVQVTINASRFPVPASHKHSSSGFTLSRALHDAGRVLTVAAGVALITLAVLIPVGLLAALAAWIGIGIRRRRREHALDLA